MMWKLACTFNLAVCVVLFGTAYGASTTNATYLSTATYTTDNSSIATTYSTADTTPEAATNFTTPNPLNATNWSTVNGTFGNITVTPTNNGTMITNATTTTSTTTTTTTTSPTTSGQARPELGRVTLLVVSLLTAGFAGLFS